MARGARLIAAVTFVSLAVCSDARAWYARGVVEYRTLSFESQPEAAERPGGLSQFTYPLVAGVRLAETTDVVLSTRGAWSDLELQDASEFNLSKFTDVLGQIFHRMNYGRLLLVAGINLPTGDETLTADELEVARALGRPVLGFRGKRLAEGLNLNGTVLYGRQLSTSVVAAIGFGVTHRGSYELLEGTGSYRPAADVAVSAGLDWKGQSDSYSVDLTYRHFGTDELEGQRVFEEGDQIELEAEFLRSWSRTGAHGTLRLFLKGENTSFERIGEVIREIRISSGTGVFLRCGLDRDFGSRAGRWGLGGEFNVFTGSEKSLDDGWLVGVGPNFGTRLGQAPLEVRSLLLFGVAEGDGGFSDRSFRGGSVAAVFSWSAGHGG